MIHSRLRALLALALLSGIAACDRGEVVVFALDQAGSAGFHAMAGVGGSSGVGGVAGSLAAGSGGASSGTGGNAGDAAVNSCQNADDCGGLTWLCEKPDCSATTGVCQPRPVSDDPMRAPVCGCDHRTYFNDTLRQQYGISASTDGACGADALPCGPNDNCGPGGSCSLRLPGFNDCAVPGTGQCWVTPDDCASTNDKAHFLPCPPLGVPPGPKPPCLTTCQALQSGYPYFPVPADTCP